MMRINVGGAARDGWVSDDEFVTQFEGGIRTYHESQVALDPDTDMPKWLFTSSRVGSCQWIIPLPINQSGWYDVSLWWCPIDDFGEPPNSHCMGLAVEGGIHEDSFDVVALSGGLSVPVGLSIPIQYPMSDRLIIDTYTAVDGADPYLSGIIVSDGSDPLQQLDPSATKSDIIESLNYLLSLERTRREENRNGGMD